MSRKHTTVSPFNRADLAGQPSRALLTFGLLNDGEKDNNDGGCGSGCGCG